MHVVLWHQILVLSSALEALEQAMGSLSSAPVTTRDNVGWNRLQGIPCGGSTSAWRFSNLGSRLEGRRGSMTVRLAYCSDRAGNYEIWEYCQSTSNVQA